MHKTRLLYGWFSGGQQHSSKFIFEIIKNRKQARDKSGVHSIGALHVVYSEYFLVKVVLLQKLVEQKQ